MFLTSLLLACTDETAPPVDLVASATAQGEHPVGHVLTEVVTEQLVTGDTRVLPLQVWYPAGAASGSATVYTVAGLASVPSPFASEGAEPLAGPLPVAVYSHGSGGVGALGYPYAERLASHGWIVVAPDHTGNTTLDFLGGGDSFVRSALDRPLDIRAVLDALDDGVAELVADTDAVLLFGHSFGGYTSFAVAGARLDPGAIAPACSSDSTEPDCVLLADPAVQEAAREGRFADTRIAAIAPQAPAVFGFEANALADLDVPVFLMSSGRDRTTPDALNAAPAWDELDGPDDRWLQIPEGGHHTFITTCDDVGVDVVATFQPNVREDGCGNDNTPIAPSVAAMSAYLVAWGGVQVLGEADWEVVLEAPLAEGLDLLER